MLAARGVSVHYEGAISALEHIDFDVPQGALVALLGANGAGKTTLMKAIAGMLPFERGEVTAGEIDFDGFSCVRAHPAKITRRGVALVQDGRQCFRSMTVEENLRAAALLKPARAREMTDLVYDYFPMLREMHARAAGFLSGGQAQMLVIAMALMGQPKLLLLDEPSLGLSPVMVQAVFDAVERVHRDLGASVVIAEQTVPRLLTIATDAYVLSRGTVAIHAAPSQITEDELQRVYLS
ncbi:MAG: ABC transporter ATP-binding protein [Hyphomicrobiales bacterium]|nr:ABC transporter ATP-binding protein [Hyphomicrobiales bacterium]